MHDRLDPKDVLVLSINNGEWESSAVRSAKGTVKWAADPRILLNEAQYALDLVEELTAQSRSAPFVEPDGLGVFRQGFRMKLDYHPNRVRIVDSASSIGMARTA
jgi:hypothetical protein